MAATLKVEKREGVGKYAAFNMRKEGFIPGIVYGGALKENVNVKVPLRDFVHLLDAGERIIDLDVDGTAHHALIKDVQHGTFEHEILHADFRAISDQDVVHVTIEVVLEGVAPGLETGGVVEQSQFDVEVECKALMLPEKVTLDISDLKVGDVRYVSDLPTLEGVTYVTGSDVAVATCHMPAGEEILESAEGDEEGTSGEPEVIGEKKEEE